MKICTKIGPPLGKNKVNNPLFFPSFLSFFIRKKKLLYKYERVVALPAITAYGASF